MERDSLMGTRTLKTLENKMYARKGIYYGCLVRIEQSVSRNHCLASPAQAS